MFAFWSHLRTWQRSIALTTILIFLLVAAVSAAPTAIGVGPAVGTWSNASPSGATCLNYYTSGGEGFVRWGDPAGSAGCTGNQDLQSGYGIVGNPSVTSVNPGDYYLLGTFTHYNWPINGTPITSVQLDLQVPVCGVTQTYNYTFAHDETENVGTSKPPCKYGSGDTGWPPSGNPNSNSCADRVTLPTTPPATSVYCATNNTTYTLFLTGFYPVAVGATCPAVPPIGMTPSQYFYTTEEATNRACVYGRLGSPSAVTLASFDAQAAGGEVQIAWETTSELYNVGFNVYRAASLDGSRTKLNAALIPSAAPNSPTGHSYGFTDSANLVPGTTYYYWLEDVNTNGTGTLHEPVTVLYNSPTAVSLADFGAASAFPAVLPIAGLGLTMTAALVAGLRRRR